VMGSRNVYIVRSYEYYVYMTRDRIFAAARAVLDREGLSGLTMRRVAQHADLSPMAIYRHFEDKEALLNALMDDGLAAWERMARSLRAQDPITWLEELGQAYLEFALREPHRFDAAFFLPAPRARQYPDDFMAGRSPVIAMAMVRIDQARAAGQLGNMPALDVILALSALAQGLVSMHRANRFSSERQFRALYRAQLRHCLRSFSPHIDGRTA
jgi:AcrR family transcriptional regulator